MPNPPDILIAGGHLVDGTGAPPRRADLVLRDGRIAEVLEPGQFAPVVDSPDRLDVTGLCVAPGFVDIHSHSDFTLLADPRAVSAITQGVTLEVIGNCGYGCAPLGGPGPAEANIYGFRDVVPLGWRTTAGYFERLSAARPAVNVAALVPNGKLRLAAVGPDERPATQSEREHMTRMLEEGLEAGAFGYSTGLEYGPERGCPEEEIVAFCRTVVARGGFYATHTRNQEHQADQAIAEAIRTAAAAGIPLQISHISAVARLEADSRRAIERALAQVEAARAGGQDVSFDMHTRLFGTTTLSAGLPPWALAGDPSALRARLKSAALRDELHARPSIITRLARGNWSRVVVLGCRFHPEHNGRSLADIAVERRCDPIDAALQVLLDEIDQIHSPMVAAFVYREEDTRIAFLHDGCMVGSDATTLAPDGPLGDSIFHGAYTWAAWFLRHFVRETRLLSLSEAIHRLTGLPARRLGLNDRGVVRPGAWADLAIFDPEHISERGTLDAPNQTAAGMAHVFVNGTPTLRDGVLTGERGGKVLRRNAKG